MLSNRQKLLRIFFQNPIPEGGFQLRELSRKMKLAPISIKNYLLQLEKEKIIIKRQHRVNKHPLYYANRASEDFKLMKKQDLIYHMHQSNLLKYLEETLQPDVIILFGSAAKGEDVKGSDIDLFIQCKEYPLDLESYESELNRKINVFFCEDFKKLSNELKNNIINGVILKGYLKVFSNEQVNKSRTRQGRSRINPKDGIHNIRDDRRDKSF